MNFEEYLNDDLQEKQMLKKIGDKLRKFIGSLKPGDKVNVIMDEPIPMVKEPQKVKTGTVKKIHSMIKKNEDALEVEVKLDDGKMVTVDAHRVKAK